MFALPEAWVWDFWIVQDGQQYHLFFLYASKAVKDVGARHFRASIGHAVSTDLVTWQRVEDALVRAEAPAFDEVATWTGSIVRGDDGLWYLFYTGVTLQSEGNVQTIGCATSPDLYDWTRLPGPILQADPRWYEQLSDGQWVDEAFRDPYAVRDPDGNGWHLLITARANEGPADDRGVLGHAWSPDLREWTLLPPVTSPGAGFGQLEVPDVVEVEGHSLLLVNCMGPELSDAHRAIVGRGGVWVAPADGPIGPFRLDDLYLLADQSVYVGRIVRDPDGRDQFLAFVNEDSHGHFGGWIIDPVPVAWRDGRVVLDAPIPLTPPAAATPR
ncbi:MAG: hypothetical protein WAV45_12995 [Propionibacteriaceae bacterium]|nr:glycosyl hydrolase family 32 [Micropruina sp.]HBX79685.1 glycosyl hydrolase family 32 [Propionibacteriaceae bacterium]HBY23693.1 glycosyl hydrolase family 32 [Propionibacteriaceae bacterium]